MRLNPDRFFEAKEYSDKLIQEANAIGVSKPMLLLIAVCH